MLHYSARFLPDGRHFLYARSSFARDMSGVFVGSIDAKPEQQDSRRLIATRGSVAYAPAQGRYADRDLAGAVADQRRDRVVGASKIARDIYILMRRLRAQGDPRIAKTPAVAVTANARAEDRRNAFAAGFQRYVSKPVQPKDLVRTVGGLVAAGSNG